ncbi:MAG: hypothetical protein RL173_430 [Fibrobacterota bacterium]|jgi:hypothetical protein
MPVVIDQVEVVPDATRGSPEGSASTETVSNAQSSRPELVAAWLERARERDLRRSAR